MKIYSAEFVKSFADLAEVEHSKIAHLPKIAFFGRSNVGKSSLIANILQRKKLIKVSSKPGKTIFFNFFLINQSFIIVDLPGYGYAKVAPSLRQKWQQQFLHLLKKLPNLKLVIHLLDLRHPPSALDLQYCKILETGKVPYTIVATKSDCLSKTKQQSAVNKLEQALKKSVFAYSIKEPINKKPTKKEELWKVINEALNLESQS